MNYVLFYFVYWFSTLVHITRVLKIDAKLTHVFINIVLPLDLFGNILFLYLHDLCRSQDKLDHSPATPQSPALSAAERSRSEDPLKNDGPRAVSTPLAAKSVQNVGGGCNDDALAPPIPPLPTNYQRSDGVWRVSNLTCDFL